jgi:hypothetical protein
VKFFVRGFFCASGGFRELGFSRVGVFESWGFRELGFSRVGVFELGFSRVEVFES